MPTPKEAHDEARWFAALGHPTRLAVIRALTDGDKSIAELARLLRVATLVARHHVQVLERVGVGLHPA